MKTSVIIPTFERVDFLPDALSSIIAQYLPTPDHEILVMETEKKAAFA